MFELRKKVENRRMSRDNLQLSGLMMICTLPFMFINNLSVNLIVMIASLVLFGFNYFQIYIQYNDKYKQGHSFIKRKLKILGGIFWLIAFLAISIFMYSIDTFAQMSEPLLTAVLVFWLFAWLLIESLASKTWSKFDCIRYQQIDEENPHQKLYFNESRYSWNHGNEEKVDLELLKQEHDRALHNTFVRGGIIAGFFLVLSIASSVISITNGLSYNLFMLMILTIYMSAIYVDYKLFSYTTIYTEQTNVAGYKSPVRKKFILSIILLIIIIIITPILIVSGAIGLGLLFV